MLHVTVHVAFIREKLMEEGASLGKRARKKPKAYYGGKKKVNERPGCIYCLPVLNKLNKPLHFCVYSSQNKQSLCLCCCCRSYLILES